MSGQPGDTDPEARRTDWEAAGKLLGILKDVLVILGIFAGAAWAAYRYVYLESYSARLRYEREAAEAQLKYNLDTGLDVHVEKVGGAFVVHGSMRIKNTGTREIIIKMAPKSLSLYRIDGKTGEPIKDSIKLAAIYDDQGDPLTLIGLDGGRETSIAYSIPAGEPGIYMLSVYIPVPHDVLSEDDKKENQEDYYWMEQRVVVLR